MISKPLRTALALLGALGCGLGDVGPVDGGPPQVLISAPANGATVGGQVSIDVLAVDDVRVDQVRILIDDVQLTILYTAPYRAIWPTSSLPNNSQHVIKVEASDAAGNVASVTATVTVSRGPQ